MSSVTEAATNVASTVIDALIASNRGDRHAFAYGEKRYSYQDVAALMNRTGNMLKAIPVPRGGSVLVLLPGSPAFVASVLGAIKSGAVPIVFPAATSTATLQECIDATKPAAVIAHRDFLASMAGPLASFPAERVVVVGNDAQGHPSFVEAIRNQSSWLSAELVGADEPAIRWWAPPSLHTLSHARLAAIVEQDGNAADPSDDTIRPVVAMLQAFSRGDAAILPSV